MADVVNIPLENAFTTTISNTISAVATSVIIDDTPEFTLPVGQGVYAVIDSKNSFREGVRITAIVGNTLTIERGKPDASGGASTANPHAGGASFVITNSFQIFSEYGEAINTKVNTETGQLDSYANAAARDAAITSPVNGMQTYLTSEGYFTDYVGGSWVQRDTGAVTPNATETVAGKVEVASASELAAGTGTGATGAKLSIAPDNASIISVSAGAADVGKIPKLNAAGEIDITMVTGGLTSTADRTNSYTPAYLTSGAAVEAAFAIWEIVTDGAFQITIDGAAEDVTGIDFTGVTSMAEVVAAIQVALRAETGGSETVTWGAGDIVITSGLTTVTSAMTVTTAGTAGTDISGAGLSTYLDCDAGNGTATAAVQDDANDAGKLVALDATGFVDDFLYVTKAPTVTVYTANDTYTKTDAIYIVVDGVGGGAGGGQVGGGSGGGGGGGAYCKKTILAAALGATETITIGTGGAATVNGSVTSFGAHFTAGGGVKAPAAAGGAGGTAAGGDINIDGGSGEGGDVGAPHQLTGCGGDSFYGFGGKGSAAAGLVGEGYGGGGSGGTGAAGGAGTAGYCVVTEYF